jgi:HD-GYP domain-containing protein (c-di-GMP phosphodiesterase class II)
MLKKISVQDIRIGMFIEKLCGSWMDHPFWKKAFKLDSEKDLHALKSSGINELWIDTSKGLDVESEADQVSVVNKEKAAGTLPTVVGSDKKPEHQVALHEETQRAQKIHAKAKRTVAFVLSEARMGNVLQLAETVTLVDEIIQSVSRNSGALLSLSRLKSKDDHVYLHSVAVSALMIALGRQMGLEGDTLKSLGMAGLLHDVGKVTIPDNILNKPGKLSADEFEIVKTHPRRGWEILKLDPDMDEVVLDVCLHHHERMDGAGYPDKLPGESLSLDARMAAVCDVYDALTSDCSYRKAYAPADAVRKMAELQDGQFDKAVFHAFVKTVGIYPVGTLVKLKSGRLAVVADQSAKSLLTPVVKVFFSTKTNEPIFPALIELSKIPDPIASVEDPAEWKLDLKTMAGI